MKQVYFFCVFIITFMNSIFVIGQSISITLENLTISNADHAELQLDLPPISETNIVLNNIPKNIDFIIFQVHSYVYNVTLSYNSKLSVSTHNHVNGTNIGLYSNTSEQPSFFVKNQNKVNVSCLVVAIPYNNDNPIPGGCNMESSTKIAPYLNVQTTDTLITVDGPPASISEQCNTDIFSYELFYEFSLTISSLTAKTYFDIIRSMLTYPRILENSNLASKPHDGTVLRRKFVRYNNVGSIYALAVFNRFGNVATYVPAFFFPTDQLSSISMLWISYIGLIALYIIGLFLCTGGHRYFIGEIFFFGTLCGYFLSYVLLFEQTTSNEDLIFMCYGIGFICGILWVCLWWCLNSPIVTISLPFMMNGFLVASIFFHLCNIFFDDVSIFESDKNYWSTFIFVVFLVTLISTTEPVKYNIIACALIGSYVMILPLDYILSTHFKNITTNVINRIIIDGFDSSITKPPFQISDLMVAVFWLLFFLTGMRSQRTLTTNRPPFPPTSQILREHMLETTPILSSSSSEIYTYT